MAPDATEVRVERLQVPGSGLAATRTHAPGVPGALFVHGWTGSRQDMAGPMAEVAALGYACLDYDLRGHGATAAEHDSVTPRQSLDDLVAAYDALAATPGLDAGAIAVVGTSFGAWLAALLTRERPVRWLALRVPALYPDECWDRPKAAMDAGALARYRRRPPSPETDRALAACARYDGDVLLVWSGRDEVLPPGIADAFQTAFPRARSLTVRRLRDADHALTGARQRREYRTLLAAWLGDLLRHHRRTALAAGLGADPG